MLGRVSRLRPGTRRLCQILGPVLLLAGFILFGSNFILAADSIDAQSPAGFMEGVAIRGLGGIVLIAVGGFLTQLGYLRVASEIVSTETEAAVEVTAGAVGRGLAPHVSGPGPTPTVMVKCRECGFLESEGATYCSQCGKTV